MALPCQLAPDRFRAVRHDELKPGADRNGFYLLDKFRLAFIQFIDMNVCGSGVFAKARFFRNPDLDTGMTAGLP